MRVYISVPLTGLDDSAAREHAFLVRAALSRKGYSSVSPFEIHCGKDAQYADLLCYSLRTMLDCDAVCFCLGWEDSLSCNVEHDTAMRFKAFVDRDPSAKNFKIMYE